MSIDAPQIQAARLRVQHLVALSQRCCKGFPADARARVANELGCMERLLTARSQGWPASPEDLTVCLAAGLSSQEMIWTVLEGFQQQLQAVEAEVLRLRGTQMLQQVAAQAMNKVARYCIPTLKSPHAARSASMAGIQKHKQHDAARFQTISTKYPHLVAGVNVLCGSAFATGQCIAHPQELEDAEGGFVSPSIALLQELVDRTFKGTMAEDQVQQVLDCLEELRQELHEDLFVDTSKP